MIYLASQSPQRRALLEAADIPFTICVSSCDEEAIQISHPQALAMERAYCKAKAARAALPEGAVVLGADTVVALDGAILGKPKDRADAVAILTCLQGTTHTVITAHSVQQGEVHAQALCLARITMRPMQPDEIRAYVESGESDGRAGAYAIQENGDQFVIDREGDFDTVVGLNVATVRRLYAEVTGEGS